MSNGHRFRILEMTQGREKSITQLSEELKLSYTKCADYISLLEKEGLIKKRKEGKGVLVLSQIKIEKDKLLF